MPCCGGSQSTNYLKTKLGFTKFKWVGSGSVKIHGGMTGKAYRFDGHGSVVQVDNRDLGNIKSIPGMKVMGQ